MTTEQTVDTRAEVPGWMWRRLYPVSRGTGKRIGALLVELAARQLLAMDREKADALLAMDREKADALLAEVATGPTTGPTSAPLPLTDNEVAILDEEPTGGKRFWTAEEDRVMREMHAQEYSDSAIARRLGRSQALVSRHRGRAGLERHYRFGGKR